MPDGPHERFEPKVNIQPPRVPERGFTAANTSGLNAADLAALNAALSRLMAAGLSEYEAKRLLHIGVAEWLEPRDAAEADLKRLLACR